MRFEELQLGQCDSMTKQFTEEDINAFAKLSGDTNPIHLDEEYARTSIFGKRVVYGMLVASLFSAVIANKLPGMGAIYLGQNLKFTAPVFIDDTVTCTVTIAELRADKKIVTLDCKAINQNGVEVITGSAVVKHNV